MKKILLSIAFAMGIVSMSIAQLPNGSMTPDFTFTDIDGNDHTISEYLLQGKTVMLEIFATWCGPCWNYQQGGSMEEFYELYGPNGTDEAVVLKIEADNWSPIEDLYGGTNSQGDWTQGVSYPIIHMEDDVDEFMDAFNLYYYPTIYTICPNGRIYETGQVPEGGIDGFNEQMCDGLIWMNNLSLVGEFQTGNECVANTMTVQNTGFNTVSSFTIEITINGELHSSELIETEFQFLATYDYELTGIDWSTVNSISVSIADSDENMDDNTISSDQLTFNSVTNRLRFELMTDGFPSESEWQIFDQNGDWMPGFGGGAFGGNAYTLHTVETFLNETGCYTIVFQDEVGDGLTDNGGDQPGYFRVSSLDENGDVIDVIAEVSGDIEFMEYPIYIMVEEIIDPVYTVCVFNDTDDDGVMDADEGYVAGVEVNYGDLVLYTGADGCVQLPEGYEFEYVSIHQDTEVFPLNTTPVQLEIQPSDANMQFGISPNDPFHNLGLSMTQMTQYFCNMESSIFVQVCNQGNLPTDGILTVTIDPLLTVTGAVGAASIDGNTIVWEIDQLGLGLCQYFHLFVEAPSFEAMGEMATNTASLITLDDEGNEIEGDHEINEHEILCSYDPNDKQVWPAGEADAGYVPMSTSSFEYLVRFQNTGNAQAFNIRVDDELDTDLDWETFELVSTSHYCEPSIDQSTGHVEFFFPDIMLPDSTSNEPESHGFIRYRIAPKQDVTEGTEIENTAYIYFDFNPAVITNTTLNTMSDLYFGIDDVVRKEVEVYPNPTAGRLNLMLEELSGPVKVKIYSIDGRLVSAQQLQGGGTAELHVEGIEQGMYNIELHALNKPQLYYTARFVKQ